MNLGALFGEQRSGLFPKVLERVISGGIQIASEVHARAQTAKRGEVKQPIRRAERKVGSVGAAIDDAHWEYPKSVRQINEEAMAEKVGSIYYDHMTDTKPRF